ncbi:MAG: prephenate dehydrogenase/arogenate dehydrogenase family protein, partial [Chloroflexota bacterium]|nr:prephenate dehydrogenase/arogenate dehydrogenase family protein [Chloroflexota bacterium]
EQVSPHVHSGQLVMDITSIKAFPVEVMHRYIKAGAVLGAHPMFGPGASSLAGKNFILTPTSEEERELAGKVTEYLEDRGAGVRMMSPSEHDKMMAVILGLPHFIAMVSADTLLSFENLGLTREISGSTYNLLLMLAESVISENHELYASLQMRLPDMAEIERQFQERVKVWTELVQNKDKQELIRKAGILRDKLEVADPDFKKAYKNMYRVMEDL